jgi:hypothetical protein
MPVTLEPISHTYANENGVKYLSASKFLELFRKPFDPTGEIAARFAIKESYRLGREVTKEEIQARWKQKGIASADRGTNIHAVFESVIKNELIDEKDFARNKIGIEKFKKFYESDTGDKEYDKEQNLKKDICFQGQLISEKCLWLDEYLIAGTSDVVEIIPKASECCIYDFKTNEKIKPDVMRFKTQQGQHMLGPISHLPDSKWVYYSLQLSLYSYMMELKGYRPRIPQIIKIDVELEKRQDDSGNLILDELGGEIIDDYKITDLKAIPCAYLRTDIINMLEYYKENYLN